jgi:regulatory protein
VPKAESDALEAALRALEHRDRSATELRDRLSRRGFDAEECEQALERLTDSGLVDDARFACARATALVTRGYGDAAVDADLAGRGIAAELRERALAELEPEAERARAVVERRGAGPRTARYLVSRGFGAEAVEAASSGLFAPEA